MASLTLCVTAVLTVLVGCQPSAKSAGERHARVVRDSVAGDSEAVQTIEAMNVVRAYYQAIGERRYSDAYRLWASNGAASRLSFDAFRSGFSGTAAVEVALGTPGRIEGAAGSRYVEVPVRVVARLKDGTPQEFIGTYTLRRSVVDGATPEQRAWRISSTRMRQVRGSGPGRPR